MLGTRCLRARQVIESGGLSHLSTNAREVPKIDIVVVVASSGEYFLQRVPFEVDDLAVVLVDHVDRVAIVHQRDSEIAVLGVD
jgi:hypothetical protein